MDTRPSRPTGLHSFDVNGGTAHRNFYMNISLTGISVMIFGPLFNLLVSMELPVDLRIVPESNFRIRW
jgi:hypothetical protein